MSVSSAPRILTFTANASISKGKAVKIGGSDDLVGVGAANTDRCIGIVQNQPLASGQAAEVALPGGGAKMLLSETVVAGNDLVSHTDGTGALPNASGDEIIARALEGGVAGDLIQVEVVVCKALASQA